MACRVSLRDGHDANIVNTGHRGGVPATEQQPDMKIHRTRTWPWFLGAIIALTAAAVYPPFFHALLAWDESLARWCNSIVGRNHMIDIIVSLINTDLGDFVIILFIAGLFAWHAFSPSDPAERNDRIAFWTFTTLAFIALYGFLGPLEGSIGRDSPGRGAAGASGASSRGDASGASSRRDASGRDGAAGGSCAG